MNSTLRASLTSIADHLDVAALSGRFWDDDSCPHIRAALELANDLDGQSEAVVPLWVKFALRVDTSMTHDGVMAWAKLVRAVERAL